jgi:hypothetical protein
MTSRDQKSENTDHETARVKKLLQSALPPIGDAPELQRDLWPALLRRMDAQTSSRMASVPWFDWALGGALLAFAAVAPRTIPVILYYL